LGTDDAPVPPTAIEEDSTPSPERAKPAEEPAPNEPAAKEPLSLYEEAGKPDGEVVDIDEGSVTYRTGERTYTTVVGGIKTAYQLR
jgi:hypothetical protein